MAADVILVNFSMLTAFALWFLFYVVILRTPDPQGLAERFKNFVTHYWLLWSFLALLVFQLSGFYPRTRDAGGVQKVIAVLRAVSSFIVLFVFADYFLYPGIAGPARRGRDRLGSDAGHRRRRPPDQTQNPEALPFRTQIRSGKRETGSGAWRRGVPGVGRGGAAAGARI